MNSLCSSNHKYLLSVLHPTRRVRPNPHFRAGWAESMLAWLDRADDPGSIEYVVAVHEKRIHQVAPLLEWACQPGRWWQELRVVLNRGADTAVGQLNACAAASLGLVLVPTMDDLFPPRGWDSRIRDVVGDPLRPLVVRCGGTLANREHLFDAGAITRWYYTRIGYLLHPGYESMYADNDLSETATAQGVLVDHPEIVFEHRHWTGGDVGIDESYAEQNRPEAFRQGLAFLEQRRAQGFPAEFKEAS